MDKWFISVTAGRQQLKSIKECKNLGLKVLSIDENPNAPGFKYSDLTVVANINDEKTIIDKINKFNIHPNGVRSFVSDAGIITAAKLNKYYNLSNYSVMLSKVQRDKELQLTLLKKNNVLSIKRSVLKNNKKVSSSLRNLKYPVIIKPSVGSGSRDVQKIINYSQLVGIISNKNQSSLAKRFIVEQFIEGVELSVETFCLNKKVHIINISKREVNEHLSATDIYTYKIKIRLEDSILNQLNRIYRAFNYPEGPGHFEFIINDKSAYVIDIAFRGGGYEIYNYMIYKATGFNIVKNTILNTLNKPVKMKFKRYKNYVHIHYLTVKSGRIIKFTCFNKETRTSTIKIIKYREVGDILNCNNADEDRIGAIICTANSALECKKLLKIAKSHINIKVEC